MPRTKKPNVEIRRTKTSLGWAHRIDIGGSYVATALTRESAQKAVPRMLAMYERSRKRAAD